MEKTDTERRPVAVLAWPWASGGRRMGLGEAVDVLGGCSLENRPLAAALRLVEERGLEAQAAAQDPANGRSGTTSWSCGYAAALAEVAAEIVGMLKSEN